MIGKGSAISSARSALTYGWNEDKGAEVVFRQNLAGENPIEIAQEFRFVQSQNCNSLRNTLSFVLSPTIEDGRRLGVLEFGKLCELFVNEMKLGENRQGIGFVHRDKAHLHIHLYINRIDFKGNAFNTGFLNGYSGRAAQEVAKKMNLKTVRDVIQEKLDKLKPLRSEIMNKHTAVIKHSQPKNFDQYIKAMKTAGVDVIPGISRAGEFLGFRFAYKGQNLKGSSINGSMGAGNLALQLYGRSPKLNNISSVTISGIILPVASKLALSIAKKLTQRALKKTISTGIEI